MLFEDPIQVFEGERYALCLEFICMPLGRAPCDVMQRPAADESFHKTM